MFVRKELEILIREARGKLLLVYRKWVEGRETDRRLQRDCVVKVWWGGEPGGKESDILHFRNLIILRSLSQSTTLWWF